MKKQSGDEAGLVEIASFQRAGRECWLPQCQASRSREIYRPHPFPGSENKAFGQNLEGQLSLNYSSGKR